LYVPTTASISAIISTTITSPLVAASATAVSTAASAADGGNAAVASVQGIEGKTCCGMILFLLVITCDYTCERHKKK
jgi:hypothetical protein